MPVRGLRFDRPVRGDSESPVRSRPGGATDLRVGVAHDARRAFAAWIDPAGTVKVRRHSPGAGLIAARSFASTSSSRARFLEMDVARDGSAGLTWADGVHKLATLRSPGEGLSPPFLLSDDPAVACATLSVAPGGAMAIGCAKYPPSDIPLDVDDPPRPAELFVFTREPGSTIVRHDIEPDALALVDVVLTERGKVVVLAYNGCYLGASRLPGQSFTRLRLISPCRDVEYDGMLAADSRGRVVAAWTALTPRFHPRSALLPVASGWRKSEALAGRGWGLSDLDIAPSGMTAFALRGRSVGAGVMRAGGRSPSVEIVSPRDTFTEISVNDAGKATIAWTMRQRQRRVVAVASRRTAAFPADRAR